MHLRAVALSVSFLLGAARRSYRVGETYFHAQQQTSTLSENLELSAEELDAFLPRAFGRVPLRRAGPQAGAGHAGNVELSNGRGARPAPALLRSPELAARRSSAASMGAGPPEVTSMEQTRRSMLKTFAAAVPLAFFPGMTKADPADERRKQELQDMMRVMGSWDKDDDGKISRVEFEKGMKEYVPHELPPGQLDDIYNRIEKSYDRLYTDPSFARNTLTDEQKQRPQPNQPIPLPTDRVKSSIPKAAGGYYEYPSPQQFYNAMVRKGKDTDVYVADWMVKNHNRMNEAGWRQVLKYESVTHPECRPEDVKMKWFRGNYAGRVDGSFDQHRWTVQRCDNPDTETTYVVDYFQRKKFDGQTLSMDSDEIEIRAQPDPRDLSNEPDIRKFQKKKGKLFTSSLEV